MLKQLRRRSSLLLFFIPLLLAGCVGSQQQVTSTAAPSPPPPVDIVIKPGYVSGKVTYNDEPLSEALVYLYKDASKHFKGPAAYVSELTGADGSFRVKVPPGNYYLVARKGENNEYYAFYGGNPIHLTPGQEWPVGLNLTRQPKVDPAALISGIPNGTGIRGIVYVQGKPLRGAQVMVYLNANRNFKGLGFDQRFTDPQGRFILDLPEGTYFLLARRRKSGRMAGPLITGDYYAYYPENPIEVRAGKYTSVALSCVQKLDKIETILKGRTIVTGRVVDESDKPVAQVYVGAYLSSQVMGKPEHVSPLTESDGRFQLELPEGGKYYLIARNTYAGPPVPGDLVGWYQGTPDHSVVIETGEKLSKIKIIITPMW